VYTDDTENKFGVANTPEEQATLAQWLFFQVRTFS
jgi:hypothetical protein